MPIEPGSDAPGNRRERVKRAPGAGISPSLREHITLVAREIRKAHRAELADVRKADSASRLFGSIIGSDGRRASASVETSAVPGGADEDLTRDFGTLLSDAIRAGTGLLAAPLAALAREWAAGTGSSATAAAPRPRRVRRRGAAATDVPPASGDAGASGSNAEGVPANPDEEMLRGFLRQYMPMLVTSVNEGGDGYRIAETMIALFGRPAYDQVAGLGKDRIMEIVRTEPDLWPQVAPIEAGFSRFMEEFTGYNAREGHVREAFPDAPSC